MAGNKRTTALGDALSKAGAYILVDKNGWPEALKFPANQLVIVSDLSNFLNKSSDLISQAEAVAGTSNTAKSWSALRVRQAIVAWYATILPTEPLNFDQDTNKDESYIKALPGNAKLEGIDFNYKSGNPVVKVGTTEGGEEILFENTVTSEGICNAIQKNITVDTDFYITITGGTVDVKFIYRKNYWRA